RILFDLGNNLSYNSCTRWLRMQALGAIAPHTSERQRGRELFQLGAQAAARNVGGNRQIGGGLCLCLTISRKCHSPLRLSEGLNACIKRRALPWFVDRKRGVRAPNDFEVALTQ